MNLLTPLLLPLALQTFEDEAKYYAVDYLTPPAGEVLEIGGMDFMPDGRLVVSTRRGQVWMVDNPLAKNPADATFSLYCEGLWEGLGLKVVDGSIYVIQRGELSRLRDLDDDGVCDVIETISDEWGLSGNYHEFAYGLPVDKDGNFYIGLNLAFFEPKWWHGQSLAPWRGWIAKISPAGGFTPIASGLRSPCGLGWNIEGDLFVTDNQGDWMAASPVFHIEEGGFYGHPASLNWTDEYRSTATFASDTVPAPRASTDRKPAALWLPYKWSRSPGNLVPDSTEGKFGPYAGQMFIAELTNGMVLRADLERVRGVYQGAVFLHRQEIGSCVRVRFAPDGTLFCGMTNRGWGGLPPADGLARMRWTGIPPMDMHSVHLIQDGFEIDFNWPLSEDKELVPANIEFTQYDYDYWWEYGSPERATEDLTVTSIQISADRKRLTIHTDGLKAGKVARVVLHDVEARGGLPLLHPEFNYTINQLPEGPLATERVTKIVSPPAGRESKDAGWLRLTYGDATSLWDFEGWKLCRAEIDRDDPSKLVTSDGNGTLANTTVPEPTNYVSKPLFGDAKVHFQFMLPKGGQTGLLLMGRYEILLHDTSPARELTAKHCGAIDATATSSGIPPIRHVYSGPGTWYEVDADFIAPRFNAQGKKIANARLTSFSIDGQLVHENVEFDGPTKHGMSGEVPLGPIVIRGDRTHVAIGDVRVKPLAREEPAADVEWTEWTPIFNGEDLDGWKITDDGSWSVEYDAIMGEGGRSHLFSPRADYTDFEVRAEVKISDGGNSGLYLRAKYGGGWPEGYEAQINSSFPDPQKTGSLYDLNPIACQLVPPDTWFVYHITCRDTNEGTHIVMCVNGTVITDFVDTQRRYKQGHIALQQHHEGSVVEVRKLEVREPR